MEENYKQQLLDLLVSFPSISKKTANRLLIDLLALKDNKITFVDDLKTNLLALNFCKQCNKITSNSDLICDDCKLNKSDTLVLVKNHLDFNNLEAVINQNQFNSYVLNINSRQELIVFFGDRTKFNQLQQFVELNPEIKNIFFSFSHTNENDVLIKLIEELIGDNFNYYQLAKGLPSGNSVDYIDQETLKHAFSKKEKIEK